MERPVAEYDYQVGGSLRQDALTYVVRQADQDLYAGLRAGEFCYVLNSRQMGKSSLRVRTMARLQAEEVACVDIQVTDILEAEMTPEQWYAGVINSIVMGLGLADHFDDAQWWQDLARLSAVQRFSKFMDEVLLRLVPDLIVIFIDEIDRILSLSFNVDGFFAVIRECYNKRADNPNYRRLTFALIGVATPSDLIRDQRSTPFNIGRAIDLRGFELAEAMPLAQGLVGKVERPEAVLAEILAWTGGQPFLTQKLCQLVRHESDGIGAGQEAERVGALVQQRVIDNWEAQDEPEHLRTIRDRVLGNEQRAGQLLGRYQQILQQGEIVTDSSDDQMMLRLTGLAVQQAENLRVYNAIYAAVFNQAWMERELARLRPYADRLQQWLATEDEAALLRGQDLLDHLAWSQGKHLGSDDYRFLAASQDLARREMQRSLEAAGEQLATVQQEAEAVRREEQQAKQALGKTRQRIRFGTVILGVLGVGVAAAIVGVIGATIAKEAAIKDRDNANAEKSAAKELVTNKTKEAEKKTKELFAAQEKAQTLAQQAKNAESREKQANQFAATAKQESQQLIAGAETKVAAAEGKVKAAEATVQIAQSKVNGATTKLSRSQIL